MPLCGLNSQPFPTALLLEAVEFSRPGIWRPDWPAELPPDSFNLASDDWASITVSFGGNSFSLRRNGEQITEFPWFFDGALVQVYLDYLPSSSGTIPQLKQIFLDDLVSLEILEYSWAKPYLLRILRGGQYFFVLLEWGTGFISESWFDTEGIFLELYEYSFLPNDGAERIRSFRSASGGEEGRRDFDSRFLITGISGLEGEFSLYYSRNNLLAYWQRRPLGMEGGNYSFQWDEREVLVRRSSSETGDSLYEYTFDSRGNWVERQEIIMKDNTGLLVPSLGMTVTRILEYENSE